MAVLSNIRLNFTEMTLNQVCITNVRLQPGSCRRSVASGGKGHLDGVGVGGDVLGLGEVDARGLEAQAEWDWGGAGPVTNSIIFC